MALLTKLLPKNNSLFAWTKIIFFCLITGATFYQFYFQIDPDFWWHLKIGEWIVQHRALMRVDEFSFVLSGHTWVDHEWITNIFFYWVYTRVGMSALAFIFGLFLLIPAGWFIIKSKTWFELCTTGFFWHIAMLYFNVRPQTISFLFFFILIWCWYEKPHLKKWLPLLFALWANLHGALLMGLVFLIIATTGKAIEKKSLCAIKFDCVLIIVCALATLLNPYGWKLYTEIFGAPLDPIVNMHVAEMHPITKLIDSFSRLPVVAYILIGLISLYGLLKKRRFELLFPLIAFISAWLYIIKLGIFAIIIIQISAHIATREDALPTLLKRTPYFIAIYFLILTYFALNIAPHEWPKDAALYIQNRSIHDKKIRLFNGLEWGGYLDWHAPDAKVFLDGHMPHWKTPDGQSPFLDSAQIEFEPNRARARALLDKWNINMILYKQNGFLGPTKNQITDFVAHGWKIIFEDSVSVVLERNKNPAQ